MTFALRKEGDTDNPILAVPYGRQITAGRLVYYDKQGTRTKFICILGQGEMDGIDRVYFAGEIITEFDSVGGRQWHFHPGTLSTGFTDSIQGRPTFFPELEFTFSGMAYIEVLLPEERSADDGSEPSGMKFMVRGRKVQDYTVSFGNLVPSGVPVWSANNALVAADIITSFMGLPTSRIDGASWLAFKTRCSGILSWDASGTGFTAEYFNDTNLANFAFRRTDDHINFDFDYISPSPSVNNAFSARWKAKIKPAFTETYTFYTYTDDGARLWVNGVQLVNDWTSGAAREHSGTIALTANVEYDLVFEYYQAGGPGICRLEWSSPSTPRNVIPKNVANAEPRAIPRFEAHVVFPQEVMATTALDSIMLSAPGCHLQDVNGKITFITVPAYTDITGGASLPAGGRALSFGLVYDPTQVIKKANIVENSFSAYRKSVADKPNFLRSSFRNLDNEFYETAYSFADRQALRDQAKTLIDPGIMQFGVMTQSLSDRILETSMRISSDLDLFVTVKGQYKAFEVAKGDIVKLSHNVPGWRETAPPLFMVVEETFEQTVGDGGSADERSFVLQIYNPTYYSDTDHGSVAGMVVSDIPSPYRAPNKVSLVTLSERAGVNSLEINGLVQFDTTVQFTQRGRVWWRRPNDEIEFNANASTDRITFPVGDVYDNGIPLMLTSSGVLPGGLDNVLTYFVVNSNIGAGYFQLALSPNGTAVNITDAGTGTHKLAPFVLTDKYLVPSTPTLQSTFNVTGAELGIHKFKVVSESLAQVKKSFEQHGTYSITVVPATILPPINLTLNRAIGTAPTDLHIAWDRGGPATEDEQYLLRIIHSGVLKREVLIKVSVHEPVRWDLAPASGSINPAIATVSSDGSIYTVGSASEFAVATSQDIHMDAVVQFKVDSRLSPILFGLAPSPNDQRVVTVNPATNIFHSDSHGLQQNQRIKFLTTGTLPAPLSVFYFEYCVILIDDDNFKVALGPNGSEVDITTAGTGTHYFSGGATGTFFTTTNSGGVPKIMPELASLIARRILPLNTYAIECRNGIVLYTENRQSYETNPWWISKEPPIADTFRIYLQIGLLSGEPQAALETTIYLNNPRVFVYTKGMQQSDFESVGVPGTVTVEVAQVGATGISPVTSAVG